MKLPCGASGLVPTGAIGVVLPAVGPLPGGQAVQRPGRSSRVPSPLVAPARRQVSSERRRVETIDDRVAACVQVAEDKQGVVHVFRRDLQHHGLEPVPDAQQVVGCPADGEGCHDDDGHLECLHTGLGDHVCATASKARFPICKGKTLFIKHDKETVVRL